MGTNFAPGGLSLVGERGPELINLPRGSSVQSNARTKATLGGGGGGGDVNITVQVNGPVVRDEASIDTLTNAIARKLVPVFTSAARRRGLNPLEIGVT